MSRESQGISDEQLFNRSAKGDRVAFEYLYDRYFNKLVWYASGFVKDREVAKDIVQDVFVKLIERPDLFDQHKKFSTWIYTVTGNQCRNKLRNEENRLRIVRENHVDEPVEQHSNYDLTLLRQQLSDAVHNLNEKERNIYTLRFEEEMSIKEIATVINIPEGSVKSGIFHLLKKISKSLNYLSYAKN